MILPRMIFCSADADSKNDLLSALEQSGYTVRCAAEVDAALSMAEEGDLIYVPAAAYPVPELVITDRQLRVVEEKKLRLIAEYPRQVGDRVYGEPYVTKHERLVILDGEQTGLKPMTLLTVNGCRVLPSDAAPTLFCMAKAAGYDEAVYGLPEAVYPLVETDVGASGVTVLTTSLTRFIRAKYGPSAKWKTLWSRLLSVWTGTEVRLDWKPVVRPAYGPEEPLPADAEMQAFYRSCRWFRKYIVGEEKDTGRLLAQEGFLSQIDSDGRQELRICFRSDCFAESAMVLALHHQLTGDPEDRRLAERLLDTVWCTKEFYNDDPATEYYGLNNWFDNSKVFYGDDNARTLLGSLLARSVLGETRWDERLLRCLLANLRTSSRKTGFRPERLDAQENSPFFKEDKTWRDHYESDVVYCAGHFEAYLWACFLLAYKETGKRRFLETAETGLRYMMETYPDGWRWTNSMTAEIARMLLPLAFLMRAEDTPEHREWLRFMCGETLAHMVPCGAFQDYVTQPSGKYQDYLGAVTDGLYPPPHSNEAFGTTEASLIQSNGDPATDLLYATNWAFLGLHEAAAAFRQAGEPSADIEQAATNIAQFLCRIQLRKNNENNDYLDGAWMRSFDFEKWEYWGSTADVGWGAWCVESGWVNTWISSLMVLRGQKTSFYDRILPGEFPQLIDRLYAEMFEENAAMKQAI